jgi:hypothetical protein
VRAWVVIGRGGEVSHMDEIELNHDMFKLNFVKK